MANCKVEFKVNAQAGLNLYVCGSVKALGEWDAAKALKLEYCGKCGLYTAAKMLPVGGAVEFKVLAGNDWAFVEKSCCGADIENRKFVAEKGLVVNVEVKNFAK